MSARRRPSLPAILAIAWLALVGVAGILAPFISNSTPIAQRALDAQGSIVAPTFPLLHGLRPMDIALPAGAILACFLTLRRAPARTRRWVRIVGVMAGAIIIGAVFETAIPPPLRVYDAHAMVRAGEARAAFTLHEFSPDERIVGARFLPPGASPPSGDGRTFILGADSLGQDVVAHLIYGCRTALLVSTGSALIALTIGVTLGAIMGWFRGWVDTTLMRFVEGAMSIPVLLILVVAAGVLPRELGITILVIGVVTWTDAARLTRAEFLRLRDQDFIAAARATGASPARIITRHVLPSALPPVLVEASFALAAAILYEASLSFLGLGPTEGASWGRLLAQGLDPVGRPVWWITVPAGTMIFLTVLSLHALGDSLRRRLAHQDH